MYTTHKCTKTKREGIGRVELTDLDAISLLERI
jgi:hypothetical protein